MPLEKYQRRVGVEEGSGGGISRIVEARGFDLGPSIDQVNAKLNQVFEPILKDKAIRRAKEDAGTTPLVRDEEGNLTLPDAADKGGTIYRAVFDDLVETNYIASMGSDYQEWLDMEVALRRTGEKPFDPTEFSAVVDARTEGLLEGMDPRVKVQVSESFQREATERKRAFINEWSRTKRQQTIKGTSEKIEFLMRKAANYRDDNLSLEQATERYLNPMLELADKMEKMGFIGGEELEAMFMEVNETADDIQSYTNSMKFLAGLVPVLGGLDGTQLETIVAWANGIEVEGAAMTGLVRDSEGGIVEAVTPDLLKNSYKEMFGREATSADRPGDHPLSIAARNKGYVSHHDISGASKGRAIDSPRIPGMTFDEYVAKWKREGFNVIEAKDEYKNPSDIATGGHWHIAFGNQRRSGTVTELPELPENVTFESIVGMDTKARALLKELANQRLGVLREDYMQSQQDAREQVRHEELLRATEETAASIQGANSNGVGGDWNSKQKAVLDNAFNSQIDLGKMADPNERAKVLSFAQTNNYIPGQIVSYLENNIRGGDWKNALELYQNIGDARLKSGARIGDLLLSKVDARGAAMLQEVDNMVRLGSSKQVISNRLDSIVSGSGRTTEEAKKEYNIYVGGDKDRSYGKDRRQLITQALGLPEEVSVNKNIELAFDAAFAANLDIVNNNPDKAMARAIQQTKANYAKRGYFSGYHGPAILPETYSPQNILDFLVGSTAGGKPLVTKINGENPRLGGSRSSITLIPADSQINTIGRYKVLVRDPKDLDRIVNSFELDLGKEMRQWAETKDKNVTIDYIEQARKKKEETGKFLKGMSQSANYGPKW